MREVGEHPKGVSKVRGLGLCERFLDIVDVHPECLHLRTLKTIGGRNDRRVTDHRKSDQRNAASRSASIRAHSIR